MDLQPYLTAVSEDLARATALADDHTREVAARVATAAEPALRLALVQALSDAAAQVTAELDGAVVTVGMVGRDPVLRVQDVPADHGPATPESSASGAEARDARDAPADAGADPGDPARVTVRLPEPLKRQAESLALEADQSLNTWIVQAIRTAVRQANTPRRAPAAPHSHSRRVTGWA